MRCDIESEGIVRSSTEDILGDQTWLSFSRPTFNQSLANSDDKLKSHQGQYPNDTET